MDKNYDVITLKYFYVKNGWVAIFADIIKIVTIFFNTIIKDSRKDNEKLCIKIQSIFVFLDIAKFAGFW